MSKRPYSMKPHILDQPLWWWLGHENELPEWITVIGPERRRRWYDRPSRIWRRFLNVRPRPISSARSFYRRGRRGYDISDTWGLDAYLLSWLPEAVADVRQHIYSYPNNICDCTDQWDHRSDCNGFARWEEVLTTIHMGLLAGRELSSLSYYDTDAEHEDNARREAELQSRFNIAMGLMTTWFFNIAS